MTPPPTAPTLPYREVQSRKPAFVWPLVIVCAPAGALAIAASAKLPPTTGVIVGVAIAIAVFGLVAALRLIIIVDADAVTWRYIPLWSRRIPIAGVAAAEAVAYRPLRDYLGWGIRYTPWSGWAINIRGDRGVRLRFEDGRTLLLGSDDPERLARAIEAARTIDPDRA